MTRTLTLRAALVLAIFAGAVAVLFSSPQRSEALSCSSTLTLGTAVECSLDVVGEVDTFTFAGTSGHRMVAKVAHVSGSGPRPRLQVLDASSNLVCETPQTSSTFGRVTTDCVLGATETYTVKVSSSQTFSLFATGSYRLYVESLTSPSASTAVTYGTIVNSSNVDVEWDAYTFTGTVGDDLSIRGIGAGAHRASFTLVDLTTNAVVGDCSQDAITKSEVWCELPSTGDYILYAHDNVVLSPTSGDYTLYLEAPFALTATDIDYGDANGTATLTDIKWRHYTFSGAEDDVVLLRLAYKPGFGFGTAPMLRVFRSDRTWLPGPALPDLRCLNGIVGSAAMQMTCTLDSGAGPYHVFVGEASGTPAGIEFYVERVSNPAAGPDPETGVSLPPGQTLSGSIAAGEADPYTLGGFTAGQSVTVTATRTSGSLGLRVGIREIDGDETCSGTLGFLQTSVAVTCSVSTGGHAVFVSDLKGWTGGDYNVTVTADSLPVPAPGDPTHPTEDTTYRTAYGGDPVNLASGSYSYATTDASIPGRGIPLTFTRSYRAGSTIAGPVGVGWAHNWDSHIGVSGTVATVFFPEGFARPFDLISGVYVPRIGTYDDLVQNVDLSYTLTTKYQTVYDFASTGELTSITDRNGNVTTLAYDVNGYLASVTAPGGRQLTFTVDGSGRILTITDPLSRTVTFTYNGSGELATVNNLVGGTTTYAYGASGMTSLTDSLSHTQLTNIYDTAGRVAEQTDGLSGTICIYYGTSPSYSSANCTGVSPAPTSSQTIVVDQRGNKTTHEFDALYRTTKVIDALGGTTTTTYDVLNNPLTVTDPLSHVTTFTHDTEGNVLERTNALSKTWTFTYNAFNDVLTATDPLSHATTYAYDGSGNLTSPEAATPSPGTTRIASPRQWWAARPRAPSTTATACA